MFRTFDSSLDNQMYSILLLKTVYITKKLFRTFNWTKITILVILDIKEKSPEKFHLILTRFN